jgi:hypothetical protein
MHLQVPLGRKTSFVESTHKVSAVLGLYVPDLWFVRFINGYYVVDGFSVPVNCTSGIIGQEPFPFINWTADPKT